MATTKRTASKPTASPSTPAKPKASKPEKLDADLLVEPTVPELLPDLEGAASNLLPFSASRLPLRVEFPMWANSHPSEEFPEHLDLHWNGALVTRTTWSQPVKPEELHIMVPISFLKHGEHTLHYEVTLFNESTASSRPLILNIDREAPEIIEGQDSLLFDQDILRDGITEEYLEAYGDKVNAQIPPYLGAEPGDILKWYFSDDPSGREMAGMHVLSKEDIKRLSAANTQARKAPYTVTFQGDFIRQARDGTRFARYEIQDRAGTPVQRSLALSITSKASPPPRVLVPPFIREATGSDYFSTLLPADASNGVTFVIPEAADLRPGETATIYWGIPGTAGAYQTSTPTAAGSREYLVPKAYIAPHTNNQVELYYQINKPDVPRSPSHQVTVRAITGLPYIQCIKLIDEKLNLGTMGSSAPFTLESWPFRDTSQFVRAWIEGVARNDLSKIIRLDIAVDLPVPTEAGMMSLGSVSKADFERLAVNYQFLVSVQVSFDNKASWLKFPGIAATLVNE